MAVALAARTAATSRLVLRDGSTAGVRAATIADRAAVRRFFSGLSAESLYRRFLGPANLSDELLTRLCDSRAPRNALALIVCRRNQDDMQIIGVGSYFAESDSSAE